MNGFSTRVLLAVGVTVTLAGACATSAIALSPGPLAGYSAPPSAMPTQTVKASVKVPTGKCSKVPAGGFQAVADGVRIAEPSGLSTGNTGAGAVVVCAGPTPTYAPHIQVDGATVGSGLTINPGDVVTATAEMSAIAVTVRLEDGSQSQTATGASASVLALEVGSLAGNCNEAHQCSPVPQTSVAAYSGALIDGVSPAAAGATKRELVDAEGKVEMKRTALKGKAKTSFNVNWVMSCGVEKVC